jgi:hypothetical protein
MNSHERDSLLASGDALLAKLDLAYLVIEYAAKTLHKTGINEKVIYYIDYPIDSNTKKRWNLLEAKGYTIKSYRTEFAPDNK